MKKFFYTIIFACVSAIALSSCTEQDIKPKDDTGSGSTDCYPGKPGCPKKIG